MLLVTPHFFPENFKANDIAFELSRRGHDVTVMTPIPDYPNGRFHDGYGVFKRRHESVRGCHVRRSLIIPRHSGSPLWLSLNYLSYTLFASLQAVWIALTNRYDTVIVHETSPMLVGIPAVIVKKLRKTPIHFWVLDLWPESLTAAGGVTNKWVLKTFANISSWIYKNCKSILISSKGFEKSILRLGQFDNIKYFPNWIDDALSNKIDENLPYIPNGFNVIFAGNIGEAQDMPNLMESARLLKHSNVNFYLFGEGRKREWIEEYVKQHSLNNIHLMGQYPLETMPSVFAKATVLFLSLKDIPIFSLTVPAKLQAYMSSGKPVVAMINGEGADLIKEADCGWSVPAGNSRALADLLLDLSKMSPEILAEKGENGKRYSEKHFNFKDCIDHLESIIYERD